MKDEQQANNIRFGFRAQVTVFMLGLLVIGVLILSILIEGSIRKSYRVLFSGKFEAQTASIQEEVKTESDAASEIILDASFNPRLRAALEVGADDGYERYFYDAIEALRLRIESAYTPVFIAILDREGGIFIPERSESPAILTRDDASNSFLDKLQEEFGAAAIPDGTQTGLWGLLPNAPYLVTAQELTNFYGDSLGVLLFGTPFHLPPTFNNSGAQFSLSLESTNEGSESNETWYAFTVPFAQASPFPTATLSAAFSQDEYRNLVSQIRYSILVFVSIAIFFGILISVIGAASLTKPIETLVEATEKVRQGVFTSRIKKHRTDEWGLLTHAFNDMTEGLETREKYRSILNKVTDPSVAELLTKGEIELGGELRTATVLFCDVRGFTPMTQDMDPREVIEMLNEHMSALTEIVQEYGGVVDKFVGDEIMALFGVPKSYGEDALSAVRCAQKMLAKRSWLNDAKGGPRIEIGIGISTGSLVAGCMGSEDRLSYTVLGATVNLGARLCSRAGPSTCLIDEATQKSIRNREPTRFFDHISVKGFSAPRPVFTLP